MGKITVKEKRKQCVISNRLDQSESVNRQAMKNISDQLAGSFLPLKMEEKKKATTIWCTVQGLVALERFMQSPMSRGVFLGIVENVIDTLRVCEKHAMSDANLELNPSRMFLETYSKRVFCIYWPLANAQNLSPVQDFFKNFGQCAGLGSGDRAFQQTYAHFFQGTQPFSLDRFEEFIRGCRDGRENPKGFGGQDEEMDRKASPNRSIEYNPYEGAAAIRGTISGNISPMGSGGGMKTEFYNLNQSGAGTMRLPFQDSGQSGRETTNLKFRDSGQSGRETTNLQFRDSDRPDRWTNTVNLRDSSQPGRGTMNLNWGERQGQPGTDAGADRQGEGAFPYLVRQRTGEKIPVRKNAFRIGAERGKCDYCIEDNIAVSRNHADLIARDGRFYVRDNRSLNKTYVDMRQVPPEGEVEIFTGTRLRLADEEFVFYAGEPL